MRRWIAVHVLVVASLAGITACSGNGASTSVTASSAATPPAGSSTPASAPAAAGKVAVPSVDGAILTAAASTRGDLEAAARNASILSYEELAAYTGIPADRLATLASSAFANLEGPVGAGPGRSVTLPRILSPVGGLSIIGVLSLIDQIEKQRDPGNAEKTLKLEPVSTTESKDGDTFAVEVTQAGLARTEVVTTTISSSGTTTTTITSARGSGRVVDDVQIGVTASSCPDAAGVATYTVAFSSQSNLTMSTGASVTQNTDVKIAGTTTTSEDGTLASNSMDVSVGTELRPGRNGPTPPGQSDGYSLQGSFTVGFGGGSVTASGGAGTYEGLKSRQAYDDLLAAIPGLSEFVALLVAGAMEKAWTSGLCVEARIDQGATRAVSSGEAVALAVAARHRVEAADVALPIDAELDGVATLEPAGKRVVAPATFTYTAGPNANDRGTVTAKVISRRGISKPVTAEYTVKPGFTVNTSGFSGAYAITGSVCDPKVPFTLAWDGGPVTLIRGTMTFTPGDPEGAAGSWAFDGLSGGRLAVRATGTYALSVPDRTLLLTASNWTIDAPLAGSLPLGPGGRHIDIAAPIVLLREPAPNCPPAG